MPTDLLQQLAGANDWRAIAPEIFLGGVALALLVLEMLLPKKHHELIPCAAIAGQIAALIFVVLSYGAVPTGGREVFGGLLRLDPVGQVMRGFFLLTGILVCLLSIIALRRQRMPRTEFFHIVLVVTAALILLAQSNHFVMLFVALETVTVGFYILVSYTRTNPLSLEAGLKYLVTGALSSGLLLFGIVLLYGAVGAVPDAGGRLHSGFEFGVLQQFLAANPGDLLARIGVVLVLAGVAFKIGAFPFQIWVPDVYQGAPTPVTAFLAVGSKAAGFAVLLTLVVVFGSCGGLVPLTLGLMAVTTILFGNLAALGQTNLKRLLGLSGVAHAGYLLVGAATLAATGDLRTQRIAVGAILFYLFAYLLASFAVFGVMTHLAGTDDADQSLGHHAGLAKREPFLAFVLAVGLGSLAGIPPLAGFMGKLLVLLAAARAGQWWLIAVAAAGVVLSIYYYFGWLRAVFFDEPAAADNPQQPPAPPPVGLAAGVALALLTAASLLLGLYQGAFARLLGIG
jgi:NADH-quinone oxidoreductase subunit N